MGRRLRIRTSRNSSPSAVWMSACDFRMAVKGGKRTAGAAQDPGGRYRMRAEQFVDGSSARAAWNSRGSAGPGLRLAGREAARRRGTAASSRELPGRRSRCGGGPRSRARLAIRPTTTAIAQPEWARNPMARRSSFHGRIYARPERGDHVRQVEVDQCAGDDHRRDIPGHLHADEIHVGPVEVSQRTVEIRGSRAAAKRAGRSASPRLIRLMCRGSTSATR